MPGLDLHVINDPKEVRKVMIDDVKEFPKSHLLHELLNPLLEIVFLHKWSSLGKTKRTSTTII